MRPHPSLSLLVLLSALAAPLLAQGKSFEEGLARYRECLQRPPLLMHARGWTALAASGDPRAVPILAEDYDDPGPPDLEYGRYLIAAIATRYLRSSDCIGPMEEWRRAHAESEDAWLWQRSLALAARRGRADLALAALEQQDDVFLRAAALSALAAAASGEIYERAEKLSLTLPKDPAQRAVLTGALADVLLSLRSKRSTKEYRNMAVPIIRLLDDPDLPYGSKLVLARHLMRALDQQTLLLDSQPWVDLLGGMARKQTGASLEYVKPTFFGIEGSGQRIVYVIDASDSMCKPIEGERPKGPVSGPRPKHKKGELPTEADIPWHLVKTRFDLAREHLKLSLRRLSEDQYFCVVLFGDRARTLKATRGLTRAKRTAVKKAIAELDKIEQGSPTPRRPDGTLEGMTNLHAGLRMAFGAVEKKLIGEGAYVNPKTFLQGADTVFVLSDGDPTWDDWDEVAPDYGEDRLGDPESRQKMQAAPRVHYHGPFADWNYLLDDVRRMNLFRRVELHCIGIGDVQIGFLKMLADIGLGQTVQIGGPTRQGR